MTIKRIVQLSADLVPSLPAETTATQHRHLRALVIAVRHSKPFGRYRFRVSGWCGRGFGRFGLRSMDWMISSSAAPSAIDERCNFVRSNPPWMAVRMVVLRAFGSSDGPRRPLAFILNKPSSIDAAQ